MLPVAMDKDADNKNIASHGSPTRRKSVDTLPPPRSSPKMQTAQPLPMAHQHHQHNQHQQHHLPHHQYYANGQHLPSPDYRASPPGAASMSLPSIQHFEGAAVQAQPQYVSAAHMNGAPPMMHAPQYSPNMVQYPSQPMPPTMPSNAPNGHSTMMRYPIPPQAPMDSRNMSGGKHRKEIKRRTKSGCLTCRKRRIKCDEAHPSCRNCQKSKRDCMGYDPVFKTDRVPSIQPAPVSSAPPSNPSPIMSTLASNSYPPYQSAGTFIHQLPPHTAPPLEQSIPYHGSVDSVLAEQDAKAQNVINEPNYVPTIQAARRFIKLTIDELFDLNDIPPQLPIRTVPDIRSPEVKQELEALYNVQYAHALDKLFETSWYTTHGFAALTADHKLCEFAVQCMDEMRAKPGSYGQLVPMPALASLEARLVWSLAVMPRTHHLYSTNSLSSEALTLEVLPRLDTVESLITGRYLDNTRIPPPASAIQDGSEESNLKSREHDFWYHLGKFTSLRDDQGDDQTLDAVTRELANMRMILNVLENRDVLYSIAVARHIGGRMPDWSPQTSNPLTNDPNDDVNKLHVAHGFVQTEDQRGTSQVIQRICSMSLRSWNLQRHHP